MSVGHPVSSKALRALAIAASMSAGVAAAVDPRTSPVAGLTLSNRSPLLDSTRRPPINMRLSARAAARALSSTLGAAGAAIWFVTASGAVMSILFIDGE
jgi:hypothetical protein